MPVLRVPPRHSLLRLPSSTLEGQTAPPCKAKATANTLQSGKTLMLAHCRQHCHHAWPELPSGGCGPPGRHQEAAHTLGNGALGPDSHPLLPEGEAEARKGQLVHGQTASRWLQHPGVLASWWQKESHCRERGKGGPRQALAICEMGPGAVREVSGECSCVGFSLYVLSLESP